MKAEEYVCILRVAGGIQVMPVRSVGQCVRLGVGVGRNCASLGRGVEVWGGWWWIGVIDDRERAVLQGDCADGYGEVVLEVLGSEFCVLVRGSR